MARDKNNNPTVRARLNASDGRVRQLISPTALSAARKAAGHRTQAELAAAVGCSRGFIGHLESGTRTNVAAVLAAAIEEACQVSPGGLFTP